jgi:hypothetical protein
MRPDPFPLRAMDVKVLIDHHTLYVYGAELDEDSGPVEEQATEAAWAGGEHVGGSFGMVAILVPMQTYADAPVRVEHWAEGPAADDPDWDFVVEFDLPVRGGRLYFQGSGGTEPVSVSCLDGYYAARLSARGYSSDRSAEPRAEFRVQLWPFRPVVRVVKQWHGWPPSPAGPPSESA